jgi:hypothetical protein
MKKNSAKLKQENTRIFRDNRTSCTKTSKNNTNSTQTKATSSYTADTTDIKVINVIGDGNCFFRCISVYFNDTQIKSIMKQ